MNERSFLTPQMSLRVFSRVPKRAMIVKKRNTKNATPATPPPPWRLTASSLSHSAKVEACWGEAAMASIRKVSRRPLACCSPRTEKIATTMAKVGTRASIVV